MKVIMNNAIRKESLISEMAVDPFIIQDFTYYQLKKQIWKTKKKHLPKSQQKE
jgi:hypothetical protein